MPQCSRTDTGSRSRKKTSVSYVRGRTVQEQTWVAEAGRGVRDVMSIRKRQKEHKYKCESTWLAQRRETTKNTVETPRDDIHRDVAARLLRTIL